MKQRIFVGLVFAVCGLGLGQALFTAQDKVKQPPAETVKLVQPGSKIAPSPDIPSIEGQPTTAVVVTQCNELVVAYVTMPSGDLVRFDKTSGLPWDAVLNLAYSAVRSERVEVSCTGHEGEAYEEHAAPVSLTFY